jgi:hypothetical protein
VPIGVIEGAAAAGALVTSNASRTRSETPALLLARLIAIVVVALAVGDGRSSLTPRSVTAILLRGALFVASAFPGRRGLTA